MLTIDSCVPKADPQITVEEFTRTAEDNEFLGFAEEQPEAQRNEDLYEPEENCTFPSLASTFRDLFVDASFIFDSPKGSHGVPHQLLQLQRPRYLQDAHD